MLLLVLEALLAEWIFKIYHRLKLTRADARQKLVTALLGAISDGPEHSRRYLKASLVSTTCVSIT